jgi:hypothetical protein
MQSKTSFCAKLTVAVGYLKDRSHFVRSTLLFCQTPCTLGFLDKQSVICTRQVGAFNWTRGIESRIPNPYEARAATAAVEIDGSVKTDP